MKVYLIGTIASLAIAGGATIGFRSKPERFPLTETERLGAVSLDDIRGTLGAVDSGHIGDIVRAYRLGSGEERLAAEAGKRLGCDVARVGTEWVRKQ